MQDKIVGLYQPSKSNISKHIKHIIEDGELDENSVIWNCRTTASDGKSYNKKYYNLEMILVIEYILMFLENTNVFHKTLN